MSSLTRFARVSLGFSVLALLAGCNGAIPANMTSPAATTLHGVVHGGQQPVTGATIQLYAVGTTGDSSAATLLTLPVQSDLAGNFSITGTYTCPTGAAQVYLVSTGGNPGLTAGTNNTAIAMMAALGQCGSLTSSSFISVDEVTTVGSIAALYPYMTSATSLGSGASDAANFATAFGNVAKYTDTSTGTAPGPTLPLGFYASSTEINTLGNIIASCINSTGGIAGDGTACGNLFNLTKSGGVAPTNTIGAMLNILNNPTQNDAALFSLPEPIAPFQPALSAAPSSWTLPILPIAATPFLSVASGTYSSAQFITLTDATAGAVFHYTTDGSTPTSSSAVASGTITVSSTEMLKVIAQSSGYASSAVASASYTITGSATTYNINGQTSLSNGCGSTVPPITVTLSFGGTIVQTTTTDASGNFSFSNVPNDTYTITPSIVGPTSAFSPTTQTAIVSGSNFNATSFATTLGYTVSGTVAYTGSQTGPIYLVLNPGSCGGGGTEGTSISSKGAFTIRGVPPGTFTLQAFMDNQSLGTPNGSNPTGNKSVAVATSNYSGANVTLTDPGIVTITSAPTIQGASGFNTGAVVQFKAVTSSGIEQPTSYTLQWSTSPTFATVTGTKTFAANGTKADAWFLNGLADTSVYYFRAFGSSAGTAIGPLSSIYGPVTIGPPTGGNAVSGSVIFSTVPTGPLYVGFLSQTTGNFYAEYIASPASAQAYTIQLPADSYNFFAILDQNSDGLIDAGDIQNASDSGGNKAPTIISGPTSSLNLTLPSANAAAVVTTSHFNSTNSGSSIQGYNLSFQVNGLIKQPVAVTLISGPNVINPVDIALCGGVGSSCGHGFQIFFGTGTTVPSIGDTYTFNVTYTDTTTTTITAVITGVLNAFATSLSPQTGTSTSTTPTFAWTYPLTPANYVYSFGICCSSNSDIWDIPANNSQTNGFTSAQIPTAQIPWNTDPTGSGSTPSIGSLVHGTTYSWQIQVQDSNGNSAQTQVQYQP